MQYNLKKPKSICKLLQTEKYIVHLFPKLNHLYMDTINYTKHIHVTAFISMLAVS